VKVLIETALHKALVAHRDACSLCDLDTACGEYVAIANRATKERQVWSGPMHPYHRLSIREAVNV
jgi:hypothetical protein